MKNSNIATLRRISPACKSLDGDRPWTLSVYRDDTAPAAEMTVHADKAATVWDAILPALDQDPDGVDGISVFPTVQDVQDGDGILSLASYVQRAERRWRIRNGYAVLTALRQTPEQVADDTQLAALAIVARFRDDTAPAPSVHDLYRAGFRAVTAARRQLSRNSERQYNPDYGRHQVNIWTAVPRVSPIDAIVEAAIDAAALTERQAEVVDAIMAGQSPAAVMEFLNISRTAYYDRIRPAYAKIAAALLAIDGAPERLAAAGYDVDGMTAAAADMAEKVKARAAHSAAARNECKRRKRAAAVK